MGRSLIVAVVLLAAAFGGCGTPVAARNGSPPPGSLPLAPGPPSNFGSSAPHDFGSRGP
jgi:hypothetical protein